MKKIYIYTCLVFYVFPIFALDTNTDTSLQLGNAIEEIIQEASIENQIIEENIIQEINNPDPIAPIHHTAIVLENYHQQQYDQIFRFLPADTSEQISELAKLETQIARIERFLGRIESAADFVS